MGLITNEVEITLNNRTIKWYENKGYEIPKYYNKKRCKYIIKSGTKIKVKVEDLTNGSNAIVNCICDECKTKTEMTWYTYRKINHNGKTYCKPCALKIFNSRENHPLWNFNKTDKEREIGRKYPEYHIFTKNVMARDKYICQCCGERATDVHHLYGYANYPEYRLDQQYALALCSKCHNAFHNWHLMKYGAKQKGNNTKEQFDEWIGQSKIIAGQYDGDLPESRWAYCITDNKIIENIPEYAKKNNLNSSNIYGCCNKKQPMYKKKIYIWYDIYKQMSNNQIQQYINNCMHNTRIKSVVCINYKLLFDSAKDAQLYFGVWNSFIIKCCKGIFEYAGISETGEKLIWKYSFDIKDISKYTYINRNECEKLAEIRALNNTFEGTTEYTL